MTEYGIFNDEGCVAAQFYSLESAERELASYDPDDTLTVQEMCYDHEEQAKLDCEECADEYADDDE